MSNTGRRKKLASFNCDQKMWEQFITRCRSKGITATAALTEFIELYLDGKLDDLDAIRNSDRQRLDSLEQKVEQLTDAIVKIQDFLNNQPRRQKSYNNSYVNKQAPRIQPLTEESLAKRLGVSEDSVREQRIKLPPPLFVSWCKGKDTSGIGWQFNSETQLYHPVT